VSDPLYGGVILERFRHPRFFGELPGADAVHEDVNPLCGDRLRVELRLGPDRGIEAIRFQGDACAIATASADLLAEMVEGRSAADALGLERDALLTVLGAPIRASRLACVALPLAVLRGALGAGAERIAAARGRETLARPGSSGLGRAGGERR
jgi:nitrogen fixation NifU-like protein